MRDSGLTLTSMTLNEILVPVKLLSFSSYLSSLSLSQKSNKKEERKEEIKNDVMHIYHGTRSLMQCYLLWRTDA